MYLRREVIRDSYVKGMCLMGNSFNYKDILNEVARSEKLARQVTEEESAALKNCLYEMAVDLDRRCRKNRIHLFLVGGTLLGAVRHHGFIPWDDDMDLGLMRGDYEKLKRIFDEEFGDMYLLRCPNSPYPNGNRFMQIFKKGTVLKTVGEENPLQPQAVYIDIFPYDYVPEHPIGRFLRGNIANGLMFVASCVMDNAYMDAAYAEFLKKSRDGKLFLMIRGITGWVFSFLPPEKWFDLVDRVIAYKKKTGTVTSATGRRHYFKEMYAKKVFLPLTNLEFRDHAFYAPGNYTEYLIGNYGEDYMVPPKEGKRESHFITAIKL